MSGTDTQIKFSKKTGLSGKKFPGFVIAACVFSIVFTLAAAGKLLYDKTLENAENENACINRQTAAALDIFLSGLQSASTILLETVNIPGFNPAAKRGATDSFFENNPQIAALEFYSLPDKNSPSLSFINHVFFDDNSIDMRRINIFIDLNKIAETEQADSAVLNCENIFGFPLLAMVFPYRRGGTGIVFFHLAGLEEVFKTGPRTNLLIDTAGDVLLNSGRLLRRSGENVSSRPFILAMLSSRLTSGWLRYVNGEGQYTTGAYSKLNTVPALFITEMTYDAVFSGFAAMAARVGCVAAVLIFLLVLTVLSCTRSIRISLKKLTEFDEMHRKLEAASRFADMRLVRQSLDGLLPAAVEYKTATMLLSGIESFPHITERLNPDEAVMLLNEYISRAAGIVKKTNGTLDQFSDGNVRAYWGALSSCGSPEHDALNCIRCALMLRVALYEFNKERSASKEMPYIKLSCGISSGEFAAGIADCGERAAYTLIGESSVLAEAAKAQNTVYNTDILITENTWHLVQKYILVQEMRPLRIEERSEPLRIFALINLRTKHGEAQVFPETLQDVRCLYIPERTACKP
jgi:adenylate cyclase